MRALRDMADLVMAVNSPQVYPVKPDAAHKAVSICAFLIHTQQVALQLIESACQ